MLLQDEVCLGKLSSSKSRDSCQAGFSLYTTETQIMLVKSGWRSPPVFSACGGVWLALPLFFFFEGQSMDEHGLTQERRVQQGPALRPHCSPFPALSVYLSPSASSIKATWPLPLKRALVNQGTWI